VRQAWVDSYSPDGDRAGTGPRARARGSGENVIKVASAPDPAMAANSSSVMPPPPSPPPLGTDQQVASSPHERSDMRVR